MSLEYVTLALRFLVLTIINPTPADSTLSLARFKFVGQ